MPLPPKVQGIPIFGSGLEFRRDPLGFLSRTNQRHGDIARVRLGPMRPTMLGHPDMASEVLVTNAKLYRKDAFLRDLNQLLGNGLLISEGDFWKRQRRLAQPPFHAKRIGGYADTFVDLTRSTVERWGDGSVVDVHEGMMRLTLEIVGKTLFGADVGGTARDVGHAIEAVVTRFVDPVRLFFPLLDRLPTPQNERFKDGIQRLDEIVLGLIRTRRQEGDADRKDLLAMLMQAKDDDGTSMSDRQVRDEVMTLFLAGHETTAIAMSWTLYLLAESPTVEADLAETVRTCLGDRVATAADVPELKLAERVVMESLRLFPPAWSIGREALVDTTIAGYDIPKGTHVWMSPWAMHRDARWFPDPGEFRPSRFEGDWQKGLPKHAYMPFGAGPRLCIGNAFAMLELTLLLATIVQRVTLKVVPGHVVAPAAGITLRPKHGMKMTVRRR